MTTRLVLFALALLGFGQTKGFAQTIYQYTNDAGGMPAFVDPGVSAGSLTPNGVILSGTCGPTQGFGTQGWPVTNVFDANGPNIEFTITPNGGNGLKITGFSTRSRRENLSPGTPPDGPIAMRYGYSINGGPWITINPGNPQSSNLCVSGGVLRAWNPAAFPINTNLPITFRIYGLSSGSALTGDFYLRDVVVAGEVCDESPEITLTGNNQQVCRGVTAASLAYTATNASTYSIDYNGIAEGQGFVDQGIPMPHLSLPGIPAGAISLTIPAMAAAGTYNGTLIVYNDCGFSSSYLFTVTINPLPNASIMVDEDSGANPDDGIICNGASVTLTASGGSGYLWSTSASATTSSISVSPSSNTTYTVTVTSESGCTATATRAITVQSITATANAGPDQVLFCDYGTILISGTFGGSATTATWSSSIMGGSFSPPNALTTFYTPPSGNTTPFTLTLTTDGNCPAADVMQVTYGEAPPLVLTVSGPADATCGDEIVFEIAATSGFTNLVSLQYKVEWDETKLEYVGSAGNPSNLSPPPSIGIMGTPSGELDYVWSSGTGNTLAPGAVLLRDTLKAISSTGSSDVNIVSGMIIPIEATNSQFCIIPVEVVLATVELNPIEVDCPTNFAVCANASAFALTGGDPSGGTYSGTGVIGNMFNPAIAGMGVHTITYTYTDNNDCSNSCTFEITVVEVPVGTASPSAQTICTGAATSIALSSSMPNTTFEWVASVTAGVVNGQANGSGNNIAQTLTGDGIVRYRITPTGPAPTYCVGSFFDVFVTVKPAPQFAFSASTTSDPGGSDNNYDGAGSISVDFCTGNFLTLSGYSDNGAIGYTGFYTTSGNTTYNGGGLGVGPVNFTIAPSSAAGFFGSIYGPYGLSSGTFGTITQVFTPYLDVNGNDAYDAGTDCLGDPITLNYNIYGPIVLNVVRLSNNLCSGEQVSYGISTTASKPVIYDLTLAEDADGTDPADLDDDNTLPIVILGRSANVPFLQTINNAAGTFDRGRVRLSITNIRYANTDVACSVSLNIPQFTTTIYPKPRLAAPVNKLICTGNSTALDIDLDPSSLPSLNAANAGYDVGVNWTVSSVSNVTGASNFNSNLTIHTSGGGDISNTDIAQVLTLVNPNAVGSVTYTVTPRSMGSGGSYDGNDCYGDPITIIVTVVPMPTPTIAGPTCVHAGAQMQLTGTPNIFPPATLVSGAWSSTVAATVDGTGLVTGVTPGPAIITYTVTDNAGCSASATYAITVLGPLTLTSTSSASEVGCGEEFTVSVAVTNFCDIGTLDYNFEWDETLFQFVTHTAPSIPGGFVSVNTSLTGFGELYYSFFDDGIAPYSSNLGPGTVILTYTLRAIGSAGTYNVPNNIILESASNSNLSTVPVTSTGVSIEIEPITLSLLGNPDVCPSDNNAYLLFDPMMVQGNPNYYFIDFDGCPGFMASQEGPLVLSEGQIVIPLPPSFISGSCSGTLVVSNTAYGCESDEIPFFILNDDDPPTVPTPAPVSQQCFPAPAPNINVVIGEMDLCTPVGSLIVLHVGDTDNSGSGGTGCAGHPRIISRKYSVTDQAGNTTTVTQTITIEDNIAPYLLTPPVLAVCYSNEAAAINAAMAHANLNKRDNCTPPVGISVSQATVPTYVNCAVTIHLVLSDACGNITLVNYTAIVDGDDPVIDGPDPLDDCYSESDDPFSEHYPYQDAVDAAIAAVAAVAYDECTTDPEDLVITATTSGTDCELFIEVSVADACGNTSTYTYTTRVESDGPYTPADPLALEGECFDTEQEAIDAAIALARFHAGDDCTSPNDLQFDAFVNIGCPADIMVVITDYCGNPTTITFTGVHIDTEDPEALGSPSEYCFETLEEAYQTLATDAAPTDNCTSTPELIASALGHPPTFIPFINEGCVQGTVVLTFTDNCGNSIEVPFEGITIDNEDPTASPLPDLVFVCLDEAEADEPDIYVVEAFDNCGVQDIIHTGTVLPMSCPGTGTRTYRVTDCAGNFYDVVQNIIVSDDVAPTFTTAPDDELDRSIPCGDELALTAANNLAPEAEDNCGEVTLVKTSGAFVPSQTCPQAGTYTNTWRAYDDCGNSSTTVFTQVITVYDNVPPVVNFGCMFAPFTAATSNGADCPNEAGTSLEVGDILSPTDTWTVAGILIPSLQGCVTDNCSSEGEINIEVTAIDYDYYNLDCSLGISITFEFSDACGNVNPMPFVCEYFIIDDVAPTWVTPQGAPFPTGINVSIACDDVDALTFANTLAPVAYDECSGIDLTKSSGPFVTGGDCPQEGSFTNTWTAEDDCGNTSIVFTQVITVVDNAAPVWSTPPTALNATVSCSDPDQLDDAQALAPVAQDNCDASIAPVKNAGVLVPGNCPGTGMITNTWTVTDDCGNISGVYTQVITVVDNEDPSLFCPLNIPDGGGPTIDDCYSSVEAAEADALEYFDSPFYLCDNCTAREDLVLTVSTNVNYPGYPCVAPVTVTLTDCAGNTDSYTFYTRIDGTKPTLVPHSIATCYPTLGAAQAAIYSATTISDNCSAIEHIAIAYSNTGNCPSTSITMTATDECGNSRSITYNGLCIGSGSSVMITVQASPGSANCTNEASALAAWLANHGGAVATGSGVTWAYPPVVFGAVNCMTHSKVATVVFTATDGCGYTAQTTSTFTVTDNTPPTANLIANTNLTCNNGMIPAADINVVTGEADNCGGTPTVTVGSRSDNMASGCPGSPRVIIQQYIVTDAYCNTAAINQMITVVDNVKPTFTAPANFTITENASCVYNASTAVTGDVTNEADNCTPSGPGLQAIYTDVVTAGPMGANPKFIITRTWTLSDACGNTAIPQTQTITVNDNMPPTISGCPANISQTGVPAVVDMVAYPCTWTASGLPALTLADNCGSPTLTYQLSGFFVGSSSGSGPITGRVFLEGVTTVTYTITDAVGNTATCAFTVTVNCVTISGRIIWEHNHALGVGKTTVNLNPTAPQVSFLTLADGNYTLTPPAPGNYAIKPVKNINRLNGVTSADATAILNHVNGSALILNPYKKVCADVNRSNIITSQDATVITQSIAGYPPALAVFSVFWRFVDAAFVWPAPVGNNVVPIFPEEIPVNVMGSDMVGKDFYGMKIGDVAPDWADPANTPGIAPLVWVLQDQTLVAGEEIDLTFAASNFDNLTSYQFALDFDPSQLQFVGFQPLGAIPMNLLDNFGAYHADLGELRHVWSVANGTTLADGTPVFRAKFKVLASGQKLSQVLKLDDSEIDCKAFSGTLVPSDVKLAFAESVGTGAPLELGKLQLQLMQNRPNPFSDATTIGFILPEACEAHIRILDISGRELATYDRKYTAGYHELDFRMENAASYGMLFCELVTPQGKRTIKMITAK